MIENGGILYMVSEVLVVCLRSAPPLPSQRPPTLLVPLWRRSCTEESSYGAAHLG